MFGIPDLNKMLNRDCNTPKTPSTKNKSKSIPPALAGVIHRQVIGHLSRGLCPHELKSKSRLSIFNL